jgi:DNA-binding response OmpR family regulator
LAQVNILFVEDYNLVLSTVKQLLELEGWAVEICRDGTSALKRLESPQPFDLIVLDSEMIGLHGLDLLRRARSMTHRRRTPVIMFTATECESEAFAAGADAFLKKPSGIRDLIPTVERLLGNADGHFSFNDQQSSQGRN